MDDHDPMYVPGIDDLTLPLRKVARELDGVELRLREHLARYPEIRLRLGRTRQKGTSESQFARRLIANRRRREAVLGGHLFADPAWDMLLDLFAAHQENVNVSVSSLCIAAGVPATTALRWISGMTKEGILIRRSDPKDRRRIWIALAPHMVDRMQQLLGSWMGAEKS